MNIQQQITSQGEDIGFSPIVEYHSASYAGQVAFYSSTLADDPVLQLFSILIANVRADDLHNELRRILGRHPELAKRQALEHLVLA